MTTRILATDPKARELLAARIAKLEAERNTIKLANKMVAARNTEGLLRLGFTPGEVAELLEKGGFSGRDIRNRTSNIDNLKRRLAGLGRAA